MTQALIRRAFESTLKTWADANTVTVAWENVTLEPQPTALYLRAFLLPADTISRDIGRANRRYAGLFQISIVAPISGGAGAAEVVVGQLSALFPPNAPIVVSGLSVWPSQPLSSAPAIIERDRFVIPCTVPYLADTY